MGIDLSGLDELEDWFDEVREKADELQGGRSISVEELFSDEFIQAYSRFDSLEEFFEQSPADEAEFEDLEEILPNDFDSFVSETTDFSGWEDMTSNAFKHWVMEFLELD